jgi:hypothetical protein
MAFGALVLRDVAVHVRDRGDRYETCVSAKLGAIRIDACGVLEYAGRALYVRGGHVELAVPAQTWRGAALGPATISADVSGNLSTLDLRLRGTATLASADLHAPLATAELAGLTLPFSVHARGGAIAEDAPLVVQIARAAIVTGGKRVPIAPAITLHAGWPRWSANVAWTGLDLAVALPAATRGRVTGTGVVDGELVFRGDRTSVALSAGAAIARAGGELRLSDVAITTALATHVADHPRALHHRIAGALADFHFASLALAFGADPDVRISLAGRGNRVPQELDLTINVRNQP